MSETFKAQGNCLCGSVKIVAKTAKTSLGACHCRMCREWTGGPLMALECGTEVSFEGQEHIKTFDSSEWADRGFCSRCGSGLFYRLKESKTYFIPFGLMKGADSSVVFDHQVFIDEKPESYSFKNQTKDMTGAEVFAQFGAS